MFNNTEQCYDCDSLKISYKYLCEKDGVQIFEAFCRDCGADWEFSEED